MIDRHLMLVVLLDAAVNTVAHVDEESIRQLVEKGCHQEERRFTERVAFILGSHYIIYS